jgi:hypothetical protein
MLIIQFKSKFFQISKETANSFNSLFNLFNYRSVLTKIFKYSRSDGQQSDMCRQRSVLCLDLNRKEIRLDRITHFGGFSLNPTHPSI